ncbi:MAG: hypothetical protein ABJ242_01930 [Marinomonas sp.]
MEFADEYVVLLASLLFVLLCMGLGAKVIMRPRTEVDDPRDARRVAFAAATFAGITVLLAFAIVIDVTFPKESGTTLPTLITAFTPIAGTIVGYVLGSKSN